MSWWHWVLLSTVIVVGGLVLHLWLWWKTWLRLVALGREAASLIEQGGELTARAGELGLAADRENLGS